MHTIHALHLRPSSPRGRGRAARRGLTLVEIATVVALVAILATLATQRVRLQLAQARSAEAVQMVGGIARALTTTFAVKNNESGASASGLGIDPGLCRDAAMVPALLTAVQRRKYQPRNSPNRDYNTGNAMAGWRCVGFMNEQPQSYQYRYNLGLPPINPNGNGPPQAVPGVPLSRHFAISARGDVDGDNQLSWFILTGYAVGQDLTIASAVAIVNQEE